ncbi:PREDICTED: odorant receptor 4-like [Wasmannia auropunctata]|uniref:odorant receptor 4-like n=1 Tax=Wasmannia auropunctata TaxID=64793 RepID=UPI0005EE676F|nr:PREDICTED: odorant receptor 4-like [Wasmannia auropunctata]
MVSVICLSLNLYGITEVTSFEDDIEQFLTHLIVVIAVFLYFFVLNYIGQEVTDHNSHVFSTAYNVRWYVAPLHVQKLILFLLQKGNKTFVLRLGRIFGLSLEFFATLTKVSISYFTIVSSLQQ